MEKRGRRENQSRQKRGRFSAWLAKVPFICFAIIGLVYSLIVLYLSDKLSGNSLNIIFFSIMGVINFLTLGYSFRLKISKARKLIFAGSLSLIVGFVLNYFLIILYGTPIASVLGFLVDICMTGGYLLELFGIKKEILK